MITVEEAFQFIAPYMSRWTEGDVLLESVTADRDYPPFHRVMMDGIAVRFDEYEKGRREFRIEGIASAGQPQVQLQNERDCFEVMTGAPLPLGADLVIPYEQIKILDGLAVVELNSSRQKMENVHAEGSDCKRGDVVLRKGSKINGPHRGILASMGRQDQTPQRVGPRVLIISTGDELVPIEQTPMAHQIRCSNAHALKESLHLYGWTNVELAHLQDELGAVTEHYQEHSPLFDLMIYSGGVSKGKFDYLPVAWRDSGVTKHFHEVAQRPGKPLWFGHDENRGTLVFGLPGNPVSSLVCCHRYILPYREVYARLDEEIVFQKKLTYFYPVKVSFDRQGVLHARPIRIKNSGEFTALAGSDGFIELPREQDIFKAGDSFKFYPWRPW